MSAGSSEPSRWRAVRRLLLVRLDQIGDVLMTTPAMAALRQALPAARVTLLTSPSAAALAPHLDTLVDDWWCEPVPWMPSGAALPPGAETALVQRLAAADFDAAVIFTVCTQSALPAALLCRMAGIPLRLAHARENPYGLLSDWAPEIDHLGSATDGAPARPVRHEVRRQLDLVARAGFTSADDRLRFTLREADRAAATLQLGPAAPDGAGRAGRAFGPAPRRGRRPYAVLHPGASAASRRWPADRFGTVARALARQGLDVLVCSGPGEAELAQAVLKGAASAPDAPASARAGVVRPVADLSLGALAALMERAALVVANNSGPAHLAAAVGAPLVCLYAQTNPQHTPWTRRLTLVERAVSCAPCLRSRCPVPGHPCLNDIQPQAVLDAAGAGLRPWPPEREDDAA